MDFHALESRYRERNPASETAFRRACEHVPGGVHGNITFFSPYPLTFRRGSGAWLEDVDGHRYVDYLLAFGALALGHGHAVVRSAVNGVWDAVGTTAFGASSVLEGELAEIVTAQYPGCESVRFTNSGLEATLLAIRLGMAYTGRTHIATFAGHYHGSLDQVLVSMHAPADTLDPLPETLGLADYHLPPTIVLPFNNWEACEKILTAHRTEVGVVMAEPMEAGVLSADPSFMRRLANLTRELGMLLVFNEVTTGFRVALGGAQEFYGVRADLTALGKILGGGLPMGAVGGRREVMELCAPRRALEGNDVVFHSGTFNGNPLSVSAGLATLRVLRAPGVFPALVEATGRLRRSIEERGRRAGLPLQTIGVGALFDIVFSAEPVRDYHAYERASMDLRRAFDFLLMERGIFSQPLNRFSLSTVHGESERSATLAAVDDAVGALAAMV